MPFSVVDRSLCFEAAQCFHVQSRRACSSKLKMYPNVLHQRKQQSSFNFGSIFNPSSEGYVDQSTYHVTATYFTDYINVKLMSYLT
jgi:hypothetical protein